MNKNYDNWKLVSPTDYICPSPHEDGWIHEDDLPNFNDTRDFLVGVIECVYETGDIEKLEGMLDELCYQFGVPMPKTKPIIEMQKKSELMDWYLKFQKKEIEKQINGLTA